MGPCSIASHSGNAKITSRVPVCTCDFYIAVSGAQPVGDILPPFNRVGEPHKVSAVEVTGDFNVPYLNQERPVAVHREGHPCFEQDVWPRLTTELTLIRRLIITAVFGG
jgi:hypothetical protein